MISNATILIVEDEMLIAANISMQLTNLGYQIIGIIPRGEEVLPSIRLTLPDIILMSDKLKGKLLITHGGIDENFNPSATFKLAEALIKNNKKFDMLILPSQRHGYEGIYNDYFTKKKWNYFIEHLRGVKPIWDFELN